MNYMEMSDESVDELLVNSQEDLGLSEELQLGQISASVKSGISVIERRQYGVAIVQPLKMVPEFRQPYFWLLYIDPDFRSRGYGKTFVRTILKKYADTHFIRLHASGSRRSRFFSRLGFRVIDTDSESGVRTMEQK